MDAIVNKTVPPINEGLKMLFENAPVREFENGPKVKGYFQMELEAAGITKKLCKILVRRGFLKMGWVHLKKGTQNFYTLQDIKTEWAI